MLIDRTGNIDWTEKKLAAKNSLFHFLLWQLAHELNLANLGDQTKKVHLLSTKIGCKNPGDPYMHSNHYLA